jgi:predicted membrane channel-forming protein YqfA (hemolysin III family)
MTSPEKNLWYGIYNPLKGPLTHIGKMLLSLIWSLFLIVVNIIVLVYLNRLEKMGCKCAEDFRKTYVQVFLIVTLVNVGVMAVFMTWLSSRDSKPPAIVTNLLMVWLVILFCATVVYIVFALQYIHRLRDEKCGCSKAMTRDVWEVVLYIRAALLAAFVLTLAVSASSMVFPATQRAINKSGKNSK